MSIVLIGMPGCGKSSVGKQAAKRLNKGFVDMDAEIEREEGKKISQIFEDNGEAFFRSKETACLKRLIKGDGVISAGGGIVVRDENVSLLKKSGALVIFIDRPTEKIMGDINTDKRPLLKDNAKRLMTLYEERYEKYLHAASVRVINDTTFADAVEKIINEVKGYENNGN